MANPTDLFWVMRALLLLERDREYRPVFDSDRQPDMAHLRARDMLEGATIRGAEAIWMGDRIGSLTPGKEADLVLLDARGINMQPLNDVATTIVLSAQVGNVDTVMVGGRIVKRAGRMVNVDVDRALRLATEARDRVYMAASRSGYTPPWRSA